jgi:cell cycle checkpoint control protein RAD9A
MTVLNFILSPEAVGKLNNALVCLGRFSESVSIESNKDHVCPSLLNSLDSLLNLVFQLVLSALNSTRSAYASFTFPGSKFFTKYSYNPSHIHGQQPREKFTCRIYNKVCESENVWYVAEYLRPCFQFLRGGPWIL